MSENTGGPAFPSHGDFGEITHEGMTLRDYFAAKATQAILSNPAKGGAELIIKPGPLK